METTSAVSEQPQKGKRAVGAIVKLSTIKKAPSRPFDALVAKFFLDK